MARDTSIFQRGGAIVQILYDYGKRTLKGITRPANNPRIATVRDASLRERLTAVARFVKRKETEDGEEFRQIHPPALCVSAVAARCHWPDVRHLEGVTRTNATPRGGIAGDGDRRRESGRPGGAKIGANGLAQKGDETVSDCTDDESMGQRRKEKPVALTLQRDSELRTEPHLSASLSIADLDAEGQLHPEGLEPVVATY